MVDMVRSPQEREWIMNDVGTFALALGIGGIWTLGVFIFGMTVGEDKKAEKSRDSLVKLKDR